MFRAVLVRFPALSPSCVQGSICTWSIYPFAKGLQSTVNECKDVPLLVKFAYFCCCIWQTYRVYSSMLCSMNCGREQKTLKRSPEVMLRWEIRQEFSEDWEYCPTFWSGAATRHGVGWCQVVLSAMSSGSLRDLSCVY